jgi:OmpA-OmpF porin, OOP family
MNQRPNASFIVEGHTDNQGDDAYNLTLSKDRAASVVAWLAQQGIDPARLQSDGFGESRPVAGNDTETGRQLNRRVEIAITR